MLLSSVVISGAICVEYWFYNIQEDLGQCENNLMSLREDSVAFEQCKKSLRYLRKEAEVWGSDAFEQCKKNLRSLRKEAKAWDSVAFEQCEINLMSLRDEAEAWDAVSIALEQCEKKLMSLQEKAEAGAMLEQCEQDLMSLREEAETWDVKAGQLSGQWGWVFSELGLGASLTALPYVVFSRVPLGYRKVKSLLFASFMTGVTIFIDGTGRLSIILWNLVNDADLTGDKQELFDG